MLSLSTLRNVKNGLFLIYFKELKVAYCMCILISHILGVLVL
jgi:hypothetical protein